MSGGRTDYVLSYDAQGAGHFDDGLHDGPDPTGVSEGQRVKVRLRVQFMTEWGQRVVMIGEGPLLGDWDPHHGWKMEPVHLKFPSARDGETDQALCWQTEVPVAQGAEIRYQYLVLDSHGQAVHRECQRRSVRIPQNASPGDIVEIRDAWLDRSAEHHILTKAAFSDVILRRPRPPPSDPAPAPRPERGEVVVRFRIATLVLLPGQEIYVTGSAPQLGSWVSDMALPLSETASPYWEVELTLPLSALAGPGVTYHYAIRTGGPEPMVHETGNARRLCMEDLKDTAPSDPSVSKTRLPSVLVCNDGHFRHPAQWRGAGVSAPLFSLRSRRSLGCGDMGDLCKLVDMCNSCGFKILQLLPINDTSVYRTWRDSYPYACISVHALHPLYLSMDMLLERCHSDLTQCARQAGTGGLRHSTDEYGAGGSGLKAQDGRVGVQRRSHRDVWESLRGAGGRMSARGQERPEGTRRGAKVEWSAVELAMDPVVVPAGGECTVEDFMRFRLELDQELDAKRAELDLPEVDYEATMTAKMAAARRVFDTCGAAVMSTPAFADWFRDSAPWLRPYAAFLALRDIFGTAEHWRWGALATPTPADINRLTSPAAAHYRAVAFTFFLQYHLHLQLSHASHHAEASHVALKGDLPIGVERRSVDVWVHPHLFRTHVSLGAPPDYFNASGQNWGFPGYHWDAMARDGYRWWRARLGCMARYFHAYRIDHVLGFFRVWEIPAGEVTGMLGRFRPALPLTPDDLRSAGFDPRDPADVARLADPHVSETALAEAFGGDEALLAEARDKYLEWVPNGAGGAVAGGAAAAAAAVGAAVGTSGAGRWALRPQWCSEERLKSLQGPLALRDGLMRLRQNVLCVRDPDNPDKLHPRIGLDATESFRALPETQQDALRRLHDAHFFERQERVWRRQAHATLPALLEASSMLVCGEDLGMIPACVPPVMHELGVVGLRIQRMPFKQGEEFAHPKDYTYMTVCQPTCHDVVPVRLWWEEEPRRTARFAWQMFKLCDVPDKCNPDVLQLIVKQHLDSPSVLCILLISDVLALIPTYAGRDAREETINDPTNPHHYWRYRMHVPLETLLDDDCFIGDVQEILFGSSRIAAEDVRRFWEEREAGQMKRNSYPGTIQSVDVGGRGAAGGARGGVVVGSAGAVEGEMMGSLGAARS